MLRQAGCLEGHTYDGIHSNMRDGDRKRARRCPSRDRQEAAPGSLSPLHNSARGAPHLQARDPSLSQKIRGKARRDRERPGTRLPVDQGFGLTSQGGSGSGG